MPGNQGKKKQCIQELLERNNLQPGEYLDVGELRKAESMTVPQVSGVGNPWRDSTVSLFLPESCLGVVAIALLPSTAVTVET